MTIDKIKKILADTLDVSEDEISADTNIATDLGADSLDVVEILMPELLVRAFFIFF